MDRKDRIVELAKNDGNLGDISLLVEEAAVALLEQGFDFSHRAHMESLLGEALHTACMWGQIATVTYFVEEVELSVELTDSDGDTALHNACYLGDPTCLEVVKYLVKMGSDVNARNSRHETPLHYAHSCPRIVKYLVEECEADADVLNLDGYSPLAFVFMINDHEDDCNDRYELARCLVPRTTLDADLFTGAWECRIPTDVKELLVKTYTRQEKQRGGRLLPCGCEYWSRYPLHAAFYAPLPSEDAMTEFVGLYGRSFLYQLDCLGRLPIHAAFSATNPVFLTPSVIARLMELEPRAAFIRDPITRFYPFEMAATLEKNENEESSFDDRSSCPL